MDIGNFKELVAKYVGYNFSSHKYDRAKVRRLASELGFMPSTVVRWASGENDPHPLVKVAVTQHILIQKVKELVGEYINYDHSSGSCSREKAWDLCEEFGAPEHVVIGWATGGYQPVGELGKQLVIQYILSRK